MAFEKTMNGIAWAFWLLVIALIFAWLMPSNLWPQTASYRAHGPAALNSLQATPGAVGAMSKTQLCDPSFRTGTVRNVTQAAKLKACALYGVPRERCTGKLYEIDHLISLELGGTNDLKNLWPQPYNPKPGAKEKDSVENILHRQVCTGTITLQQAQKAISTDWYAVYLSLNLASK